MVKILGLRITPFFLIIIALQSLALLLSLYIGILLYQDTNSMGLSTEVIQRLVYSGLFLLLLLSILTPGFFYQTKVITYIKKTIHERTPTIAISIITMLFVLLINGPGMNARMFFISALMSASAGVIAGQFDLLTRYWRFLIRSGLD